MGLTLILTDEGLCNLMCGAPEQDDEETEDEKCLYGQLFHRR